MAGGTPRHSRAAQNHEAKAYQELPALHSAMLEWQHRGCSAE